VKSPYYFSVQGSFNVSSFVRYLLIQDAPSFYFAFAIYPSDSLSDRPSMAFSPSNHSSEVRVYY